MTTYASKELAERLMSQEGAADVVDDRLDDDGNLIEDWFGADEDGQETMWYTLTNGETGEWEYQTREWAVANGLRVDWD